MKIAICTIIKQENLYLRDWVEYYLKMGVSNIILYDNNDINGEFPQHVIGDYIESGVVIYENARGLHRYQIEAYNNCYEKYKNIFIVPNRGAFIRGSHIAYNSDTLYISIVSPMHNMLKSILVLLSPSFTF